MLEIKHMVRKSPGSGTHLVVNETHLVLDLTWWMKKILLQHMLMDLTWYWVLPNNEANLGLDLIW